MKVELELGILDADEREQFWKLVNARNDVIHVQPDLDTHTGTAIYQTAGLLGSLMPFADVP